MEPTATANLKQAITDPLRTDEASANATLDRFVEMREGIVEQLLAQRHHLVVGRRGVVKSTLIHHAASG